MRQAGVLAAAGIYALEHNVERLAEDHDNARRLAEGLRRIDEIRVSRGGADTNMVLATVEPGRVKGLHDHMSGRGIRVRPQPTMRLVTHLDVDRSDVDRFVRAVEEFFSGAS